MKRELEGGWFQWVEMPLPALLTIQSGINKPRYATLKGIKGAKTKEIKKVTAADLGLKLDELAGRQKVLKIYVPREDQEDRVHRGLAERGRRGAGAEVAAKCESAVGRTFASKCHPERSAASAFIP